MTKLYLFILGFFCSIGIARAQHAQAHFEGILGFADSSQTDTSFTSGHFNFIGDTTPWGTWTGWALSSMQDTVKGHFTNDLSAITGTGVNHSRTYAIAYANPALTFKNPTTLTGTFITNTTYTYKVIKNGNQFSKKFGGPSGNDSDSFVVRAYGYLNGGIVDSSDFYLADYRFTDNTKDYIIDEYVWWDLSTLGKIDSMNFTFFSSDTAPWGLNTPTYFCIDNFNGTAPDSTLAKLNFETIALGSNGYRNGSDLSGGFYFGGAYLHNRYNANWMSWSGFSVSNLTDTTTIGAANQYSAFAGEGLNQSDNFVVANGFGDMLVELPYNSQGNKVDGVYLTNNTYAALSMRNGDGFAKKFGGASGNEEDWFKVDIIGYNYDGLVTDTVEFYLADYRFSNNALDYIVKDWTWVDLSDLGNVTKIRFELSSTDTGRCGMNTPAYFCMDGFNMSDPVGLQPVENSFISLYPNPSSNQITIDVASTDFIVYVYDLKGNQVSKSTGISTFDVSDLNRGRYVVRLITEDKSSYGSFVKL